MVKEGLIIALKNVSTKREEERKQSVLIVGLNSVDFLAKDVNRVLPYIEQEYPLPSLVEEDIMVLIG